MGASSTLLNTVTLSDMTDLVEKEFLAQNDLVQSNAKSMYIMDSIPAGSGDTRRYEEVDTETFASVKPEGTDASLAQVGTGYYVTGTVKRIAKEIQITWEMRRYNKFPEVAGQITSLTQFCPQRAELDATHLITFGESTTYTDRDGISNTITVGDGFQLFYASHTLAQSSSTYTNLVSGSPRFSQGALEAAELLTVTNILSNFGERRVMNFNTIFSSDDPSTVRAIRQVLQSTTDVDQSNSGVINAFKGKYTHLVLPYLATSALGAYNSSKAKYWGIGAFSQGQKGWQAYFAEAEAPNMNPPDMDSHSDNWTFGVRMAYLVRAVSGRGIILSPAS